MNDHLEEVQDFVIDKFQDISGLSKKKYSADSNTSKISCIVDVQNRKTIKDLYKIFKNLEGIESILIQETLE